MVLLLFGEIVLLLFGTVGLLLLFEARLFGAMVKLLLDTPVGSYIIRGCGSYFVLVCC